MKTPYTDDGRTSIRRLITLRIPSLVVGLILGLTLSFVVSKFDEVLSKNIAVAFFIPFIVYLADAVGTQTETVYVRALKSGTANFKKYLLKESALGISLGVIFSLCAWPVVYLWFGSADLAFTVSSGVLATVSTAPIIALIVSEVFALEHEDPALWGGPIATVIQDTVSVVIFGLIASAILL